MSEHCVELACSERAPHLGSMGELVFSTLPSNTVKLALETRGVAANKPIPGQESQESWLCLPYLLRGPEAACVPGLIWGALTRAHL